MRPVGSKYLLEEPLGRGATGTVWRARQRETAGAEAAVPGQPGETVAIKVLKEELANDPDVVMRFLRERSVLLRLTHPNIVRTRDLVVEGDLLALPFVPALAWAVAVGVVSLAQGLARSKSVFNVCVVVVDCVVVVSVCAAAMDEMAAMAVAAVVLQPSESSIAERRNGPK